jgi:protein-tyrosine phosphatase
LRKGGVAMIDKDTRNTRITDFHSHILPYMDDGSSSVEESIEMLRMLREQGVDMVVATPHFYPKREDPQTFFKRRSESAEMLRSALKFADIGKNEIPEIYLGAEVAYFNGMSMYKSLNELCIEGTNVMLVEMPFSKWTDSVVNEICAIQANTDIQVVLAHIDRYGHYYDSQKLFKLKTHRVILQANADPFLRFMSCRRLVKMMHMNSLGVLGSDFHNMTTRPSNLGEAIEIIRAKGLEDKLDALMKRAEELLDDAKPLI